MVVACFRGVAGGMEPTRSTREMCRRHALQACSVNQLCLTLWKGLPFPPTGALSDPGNEPVSPALTGGLFTTETPGKPLYEEECPNCMIIVTLK